MMSEILLEVEDLRVYYEIREGFVRAVDGVSFKLYKAESMAIVGESGSGKTTLALAIPRLIDPPGKIVGGRILFKGRDILSMNERELTEIRGREISFIFQDPASALNPVFNIGFQVEEKYTAHGIDELKAYRESLKLLKSVGIADIKRRYRSYPHQLSGGMKQRVVIAIAMALNPSLIIADEPTSGLDVTIQAQILDLLRDLSEKHRSSILLITHDIGVAAELVDKIGVMYAGKMLEIGSLDKILNEPLHPYTRALMNCVPRMHKSMQKLTSIRGMVPSLLHPPEGCRFHPRCDYARDICKSIEPEMIKVDEDHYVACHLYRR